MGYQGRVCNSLALQFHSQVLPLVTLSPFDFTHRNTGPHDVTLKIAYCGICHSDLHQIRNDWKGSRYPMVPGTVVEVGLEVKNFAIGIEWAWAVWLGVSSIAILVLKGKNSSVRRSFGRMAALMLMVLSPLEVTHL